MAEIIRHGSTIDLAPREEMHIAHNALLYACLAGFACREMPDEAFTAMLVAIMQGEP